MNIKSYLLTFTLFIVFSYNSSLYSQKNKDWNKLSLSFEKDLMNNIDSIELYNSASFKMHREHNLKDAFSNIFIDYFNSKNDSTSDKYISAKNKFFHVFDIVDIELSSGSDGLKIYCVKFNNLNDTNKFVYVIYDRIKKTIYLFESNDFYLNVKRVSIEILYSNKEQYLLLKTLINKYEVTNSVKKTSLKCYPFFVPFTNNKLLTLIYYTEDGNEINYLKVVTVDIVCKTAVYN
jgi:hypothetical protein